MADKTQQADKPLTMADAQALISSRTAGDRAASDRGIWVAKNMGDLPVIYREAMPMESDPDKLMAAEQAIREQYRKDMRTHAPFHAGYLAVNSEGSLKGQAASDVRSQLGKAQAEADDAQLGKSPPPPDLSKMSTTEKIALGLQQSSAGASRSLVTTQTRGVATQRTASVLQVGGSRNSPSTNDKLMMGISRSQPAQRR